jgi:hypothetical protein
MAGYSRHRSVYRLQGYTAMRSELALDMGRLWQRNLVCSAIINCFKSYYIITSLYRNRLLTVS